MNTNTIPTIAEVNAGLVALSGKPMATLVCKVTGKSVTYVNGCSIIDTYLEMHDLQIWNVDQSDIEDVVNKFVAENDAFFVPMPRTNTNVEDDFRDAIAAGKSLVVFENYGE